MTMAEMPSFRNGEEVQIVKGPYRIFRKGVYLRPAGEKSAAVRINGVERTIRATSIKKIASTTSTTSEIPETVTMAKSEYEDLIMEIETLSNGLKQLELKMKSFR